MGKNLYFCETRLSPPQKHRLEARRKNRNTMHVIALNETVKKKLSEDFVLFVAWINQYSFIDSDIDPTHNKGWVAQQKQREEKQLEQLLLEISSWKRMFNTTRARERAKVIHNLVKENLEENKIELG